MAVYLLHFSPSYKHAAHYLGYAADVAPRVYAHLNGRGARLTQVASEAGCAIILVRVWEDADRSFERRLKNNSHSPKLCPICAGSGVQLPLLLGEAAYVPVVDNAARPSSGVDNVADRLAGGAQLALLPTYEQVAREFFGFDDDAATSSAFDCRPQWPESKEYDYTDDLADHLADIDFWRSGC